MAAFAKTRQQYWAMVGLLCVLPLISHFAATVLAPSLIGLALIGIVCLTYVLIVFELDSVPLKCLMIGMFVSTLFAPSVGRAEDMPAGQGVAFFIGGILGCLFGIILEKLTADRQTLVELEREAKVKREQTTMPSTTSQTPAGTK